MPNLTTLGPDACALSSDSVFKLESDLKIFFIHPRHGVKKLQMDKWWSKVQGSVLAEMITDGVLIIDKGQQIVYANANFAAMIGRSSDQIVGRKVSEIIQTGSEESLASLIFPSSDEEVSSEVLTWIRPDKDAVQTTARSFLINSHERAESPVFLVMKEVTSPSYTRGTEIDDFSLKAMEMSPDMILTLDKGGVITYCNNATIEQTGYPREEIVGRRFTLLAALKFEDIEDYVRTFTEVLRGHVPDPFEVQWEKKEGGIFYSEVIVSPERKDNKIAGVIVIARNITARKDAEQQLQEIEERFALVADSVPGSVFIKDDKSNILYVNRYMKDVLGIEDGVGKNTADIFPPGIAESMIDDDRRAMREGPIQITQFIQDRKGETRVFQTSKFPIRRGTKPDLLGGVGLDITEKTIAEKATKESETKYRRLYESMEDGFVSADNDGNYIEFNQAYLELCGYEEDELKELSFWDLTPLQWHEMEKKINKEQVLVRGYSDLYEKELQRKDGTTVPIELRVYLLRDDDGEPIGTWAIVRNISLRKRAEEQLREERDVAQQYLDIAGAAIIVIDADGQIHLINRRGLEIIGYEIKEVLGRDWIELVFAEKNREQAREHLRGVIADEMPDEAGFRTVILTKSGEERVVSWRYRLLRNDFGNAIGLLASGEDITQATVAEEALRSSEAKYKQLVEQYTQGVAIIRAPLQIIFANKALAELLGRTPDELISLTSEEVKGLLHPDDFDILIGRFADLMAGDPGREVPLVVRAIRPDGEVRWMEILGRRVEYEGEFVVQIATADSTERIRASKKLRESEERYRRLSDESIQALAILQDGRYVYANPAFASIVGHSLEKILGFTADEVWKLVHPEDKAELSRRNEEMRKGHSITPRHKFRYVREDGTIRWVESFVKMIEYEGRPAIQVLEIDISAQMESEGALRDSESKYRKLVEHATLGIMIARASPIEIAFANDALLKITGRSLDELLSLTGERIENLIHPEDFEKLVTLMADILDDETPSDTPLILRVITKEGEMRWVEVRGTKVEFEEGPAIQATVVDITERITAERERQKAEDDLKTAADTAMLYLDLLGHDMRNRLQAIQIAAELLQFQEARPEALRTIDRITSLIHSSEALIEKAHATRGLISAPLTNVSLLQNLRDALREIEIRFDDVNVDTEYKVDQAQIMADEYLNHLLVNVLENAVIHNQASERRIWVVLAEKRGGFEVSVADNGEGIDDSLKSILFDQDRRFGGLGLHQSQRIITKYGGTIEAEDRVLGNPRKGAKLTLWFPKV